MRMRPRMRKNSASSASMPSTATPPVQARVRLWNCRQSRPSGWIRLAAVPLGMVMRPLMIPPRSAACNSSSAASAWPRAVIGGGAGIGLTGVGAAAAGGGAVAWPVGCCGSVVCGTWPPPTPPRPAPTSGTGACTAGAPPAGGVVDGWVVEGWADAAPAISARPSAAPMSAPRTGRLMPAPFRDRRFASPRRRSRSRAAARAPCRCRR